MNLENKVVIITGASSGIGESLAKRLAEEGARLILCSRSLCDIQPIAKRLNAVAVACDVTMESQVLKLAKMAIKSFGRIDIWINNAGITIPPSLVEKTDMKLAHRVMEVNFFGTVYGCRAAIRQMKKQKSGIIINMVSAQVPDGRPKKFAYSASKFAVESLSKILRLELASSNIKIISVYPSGTQTNLFGKFKPDNYQNYMLPKFVADQIVKNLMIDNLREELRIRS